MYKKILTFFLIMFLICSLAPLMLPAKGEKAIVEVDYTDTTPMKPQTPLWQHNTNNGQMRLARGTDRVQTYIGPFGVGTFEFIGIISVTHFDTSTTGTFYGHGNYRILLTITSGPYGSGTLEGIYLMNWDRDPTRPTGYQYLTWGMQKYLQGSGELAGIKATIEVNQRQVGTNFVNTYQGEIVLP